jgi:hypothetical protein
MLRDDQPGHRAKHIGRRPDERIAKQLLPQSHAGGSRPRRGADHLDVDRKALRFRARQIGRLQRRGLLSPGLVWRQNQQRDEDK